VSGGINISEPAVDLPVAIALISSFKDKALPSKTVAFGELDLMGNVRRANSLTKRVKEAKKIGIGTILSSESLTMISGLKI
jgi:DNA repair protein RadA/Sms